MRLGRSDILLFNSKNQKEKRSYLLGRQTTDKYCSWEGKHKNWVKAASYFNGKRASAYGG